MIKVNIATTKGFSTEELKKVHTAQNALNKILNNENFKDQVLYFTTDGLFRFHYRRTFLGKWIDRPHSNREVYEILTQGSASTGADVKQVDLHLEMLPGGDVEQLGYTNPDTQRIYTYRNWFNNLSLAGYTSHLAHEWCHQLGFSHASKPTEKTNHSVPFGIGNITEKIALYH
ncbi:hypothetical protein [Mucilaginibacter paludis]|uniref:Uncharacterized protein n=1 Tax=Mucilaginibacter paludis DSM 18603 TaxID=714943 RepID=H1YIT6_9SPHI|nr:hypothetical protein [Mucilaginibacter paludis]EHQ27631.1 hypothetical protein Mucpa_3533 [Mucilaginibacter paludis DSM 18603]